MTDLDLDLNALLDGEWTLNPGAELQPFDPFTLLEGMQHGTLAAERCLAEFGRYIAGEPLIRHHKAPMYGWSFLCPDPRCGVWQTEFETTAACRTGWLTHCDERPHEFTPAWPGGVPFDAPTQLVCWPGHITDDNVLIDLIEKGVAVDVAGRKLTRQRCTKCYTYGHFSHMVVGGRTCPGQIPCTKCGADPGQPCDRSTPDLSPINFGRNGGFGGHTERFQPAADLDQARREAGDLTLPAPWRAEMAPTTRRTAPASKGMRFTVRVEVDSDANPKWQALLRELMETGRFAWQRPLKVGHVACRSARAAQRLADAIATTCGIPESAVTVEDGLASWHTEEVLADLVRAEAYDILYRFTKDTPMAHLVWATGVITVRSAEMLAGGGLAVSDLASACGGGGGASRRYRYDGGAKGMTIESVQHQGLSVLARWSDVVKMIQGKVPADMLAEIRTAIAEERSFPRTSWERGRADRWLEEIATRAWLLARPADLPPFVTTVACERTD